MRNLILVHANIKDADQTAHLRILFSVFDIRVLEVHYLTLLSKPYLAFNHRRKTRGGVLASGPNVPVTVEHMLLIENFRQDSKE